MIEVTYTTYSEILKKSFTNIKIVKSIEDFNLFAMALNLRLTKEIETRSL